MIPTLLVLGAVLGRWWRSTLVLGTVGWVVVLLATDVIGWSSVLAAAAFGFVNTAVGVAVHQGVLWAIRGAIRATRDAEHPATPIPR